MTHQLPGLGLGSHGHGTGHLCVPCGETEARKGNDGRCWCRFCSLLSAPLSLYRTSVTEEYRVPDGMVGLSEWGLCGSPRSVLCPVPPPPMGGGGVISPGPTPSIHALLFPRFSLVIGRGGEQINKIQQDSGCKVQISPGRCCQHPWLSCGEWLLWVLDPGLGHSCTRNLEPPSLWRGCRGATETLS